MITTEKIQVKKLLSEGTSNAKTEKNELKTFILYMAPANTNSFGINLCPKASEGCMNSCLATSGRMGFSSNIAARIRKADFYIQFRTEFCELLYSELYRINKAAQKGNYKVAIRLNGTTDLDFFAILKNRIGRDLFELSNLVFYDYTKILGKVKKYLSEIKSGKYVLTFSRSENNWSECTEALNLGVNVAVVFDNKEPLPSDYMGFKVIDGDKSDIEMLKNSGLILGLKAKGKAKKDKTGFVVRNL